MTEVEKQIFEKWFKEKKEKCEVYGNGDDFYVDDEIKKFCLMGYELGLKAGRPQWHYVKEELPEELHDVLCFVIHNEHRYVLQGYLRDGRWVLSPLGTYLNNDDVIAWKEIVLPELKESK